MIHEICLICKRKRNTWEGLALGDVIGASAISPKARYALRARLCALRIRRFGAYAALARMSVITAYNPHIIVYPL